MLFWYYEFYVDKAPTLVQWNWEMWLVCDAVGKKPDFTIKENIEHFKFACDIYVGY